VVAEWLTLAAPHLVVAERLRANESMQGLAPHHVHPLCLRANVKVNSC